MIRIPLSRGMFAIVDDEDADVGSVKWHARPSGWKAVYASRNGAWPKRGTVNMHTVIAQRAGIIGPGQYVDHVNGDGLDNRRSNLRAATVAQNNRNTGPKRGNKSGYKGVHFCKRERRWVAQIAINGKKRALGYHATAEAAARAYDRAAKELHGEFARPNFPEE